MADEYKPVLDAAGVPIPQFDIAKLREEIAAPSAFSARPPFAGHLAFDIHPGRLGGILRAADSGSTREWFILAEELEELYTHYSAVLSKRKRQVSLLPITVDDADDSDEAKKAGDIIRTWLDTETLESGMYDVTDGIGKGYSVNELIWANDDYMWPVEMKWRNQRDFEVSWDDGQTLWLRVDGGFQGLYTHKFLLHRHQVKSGNPVRSSLSRLVVWKWMMATFAMKDWALFVQGYGLPVRLGKYGPGASDGDKRTLWKAVRGIGGDLAAIIPSSMNIEFVEAKGASEGSTLYPGWLNWLDSQTSKLVLGGVAGTDAVAGSHAVGKDHRAAEQDVEKFDARLIATSVNRQVIPSIIKFNMGDQKKYPRIRIGQDETVPVSDLIAAVADLGPLGYTIRRADLDERLQVTAPGKNDAIIGMPPVGAATNPDGSPIVGADLKIKASPHPEINPDSDARAMMTATQEYQAKRAARQTRQAGLFGRLIAMHTPQPGPLLDALEERVAREAGDALAAMTVQARQCLEEATDLPDFMDRLQKLKLDDKAFGVAMAQGMALAHLTGQAALLDEITPPGQR